MSLGPAKHEEEPDRGCGYSKRRKEALMDGDYLPLSIILLVGFILLEACFYGFGAAIQNVNTGKLEQDMEKGSRKAARLLRIVNRPGRFVNTIQIMTHFIGMITGAYIMVALRIQLERIIVGSGMLSGQGPLRQVLLAAAAVVVLLVLFVSFGIVIPKRCAYKKPEAWGYRLYPAVMSVVWLCLPLILLINGICRLVLKLMGLDFDSGEENVTEEDIMSMVNEGHEQGVVEEDEAKMITNIFQLNDKEAHDIMTHRTNLNALDCHMTLGEAVNFILKEGNNSRYPVYEEDLDNITGLLYMKDALIYADNPENREKELAQLPGILREAYFIPETRNIDTLFQQMQEEKRHMVIVVDEYGQTAGIVTMEDILEEIVGNIMDEYDEEEELITPKPDGSFLIAGMTRLEDVEEALELTFDQEDSDTYDTLNGFLISKLNRIPEEGEDPELEYQGYVFHVLKVESKMIQLVQVSKPAETEKTEEEEAEEGERVW